MEQTIWVVWVCVGLMCIDQVPTKYEYRSLNMCIAKGYQLKLMTGHPLMVKTSCWPKGKAK